MMRTDAKYPLINRRRRYRFVAYNSVKCSPRARGEINPAFNTCPVFRSHSSHLARVSPATRAIQKDGAARLVSALVQQSAVVFLDRHSHLRHLAPTKTYLIFSRWSHWAQVFINVEKRFLIQFLLLRMKSKLITSVIGSIYRCLMRSCSVWQRQRVSVSLIALACPVVSAPSQCGAMRYEHEEMRTTSERTAHRVESFGMMSIWKCDILMVIPGRLLAVCPLLKPRTFSRASVPLIVARLERHCR